MSDKLESLLEAQIRASNRTTRAVRALVRFIFIQLLGLTIGGLIITASFSSDQQGFLTALGSLVILVSVVVSSNVGWSELALSDPEIEMGRINNFVHSPQERSANTEAPNKQKRCACSNADRWAANAQVEKKDGIKVCTRCQLNV
jgi:hypothetical protein